jgi:hypothetical protein
MSKRRKRNGNLEDVNADSLADDHPVFRLMS